jgi:hypothetical protein
MKFSLSLAPRGLAIALGVLALAAPAALAQDQDLRAPDNQVPAQSQDLRAPDNQVSNVRVVDLRSPDARDAATPSAPLASAVQSTDDGIGGSPGIVVAAIAGFLLLALGGFAVAHRRALVRPAR